MGTMYLNALLSWGYHFMASFMVSLLSSCASRIVPPWESCQKCDFGTKMGAYGVKGALLGSCDEGLIVSIDVCLGVASATSFPVKGVVSPHDVAETKELCNRTDMVVNVAIGRLSEKVRRIQGQEDETYAPTGRRNTNDEFNHLHLLRISNRRTKWGGAHTAKKRHEHRT